MYIYDVYILIGNMICIQNEYKIECCMDEYDESEMILLTWQY